MRVALLVALVATVGSCGNDRVVPRLDGAGGEGQDLAVAVAPDGFGACAQTSYEAKQAPAAMLAVLDRSSSMLEGNKFNFAANAIVQALDQDVFDTMWVGLYATPAGTTAGPMCIFGFPVACLNAPFPQVDLALAGSNKSIDANGVRHDIKAQITRLLPDAMDPDSTPMYEALQNAILNLQGWPRTGKRILFVVTDGSFSCTSLSKPQRPAYSDGNGCQDWEDPSSIVTMLSKANKDATTPVETFIVGVPGADTFDNSGNSAPPYHMRNALSAMAFAGSPAYVPQACTGRVYDKAGADPRVSCHVDLTQGNFSAKAIADAITQLRGKVLGCTFDLPMPDAGTVNPDEVNVSITLSGTRQDLYRRKDKGNACDSDGCWDYDDAGKVQLIGKACDGVTMGTDVKVEIVVGCATIIG